MVSTTEAAKKVTPMPGSSAMVQPVAVPWFVNAPAVRPSTATSKAQLTKGR